MPDLRLAFTRGVAPDGATVELVVRRAALANPAPENESVPTDDLLELKVNSAHPFTDSFYSPQAQPMQPVFTNAWIAVPFRFADGVCIRLYDRFQGDLRAVLTLYGAAMVTVRLNDTHLTLADDRGRLIVLDLTTGRLTRDLRIH